MWWWWGGGSQEADNVLLLQDEAGGYVTLEVATPTERGGGRVGVRVKGVSRPPLSLALLPTPSLSV